MSKVLKISGYLFLLLSVISYSYKDITLPLRKEADIFYWLPCMIGIALLSFGDMINEKDVRVKYLVYNNIAVLFLAIVFFMVINGYASFLVNTNIVIVSLILSTVICLLFYLFRNPHK